MATLKLTLDKRRKYSDGRYPLILRLSKNKKSTSINIGVRVYKLEWDIKKQRILKRHPNQVKLNLHLKNTLLDYEQKMREIESSTSMIGLVELKRMLVSNDAEMELTFYDFGLKHVEELRVQKRFGNAQSFMTAINSLVEYKAKSVLLSEIDYSFINGFDNYLSVKGLSVNAIAAYMRAIRALLNKGGKLGCYNMSIYPFSNFKIRTQITASRAESIEKISELYNKNLKIGSEEWHAKNIFFLIFSLIGISFTDLLLLKKTNLKNGRIVYKRRKTGKLYSIKATKLTLELFKRYHNDSSEYLLPQFGMDGIEEFRIRKQVNLNLKSTNRYLKILGKQLDFSNILTTYVARYSWANIAKFNGFSKDLIAEALGHNYGNAVTGIYLEGYGNEVIDNANDKILSVLKKIN